MPIRFAFQHWDHKLNYWLPNTVPLDYADKTDLPTHGKQSITQDFLMSHPGIECQAIEPNLGKKYIFPVQIRDSHYFERHEHIGFDCVDPRVLDDVRNNLSKIVLIFPNEGDSGLGRFNRDHDILDAWCERHRLNSQQVYFIHGNQNVNTEQYRFTKIPANVFVCWNDPANGFVNFEPIDSKNLFLNYNRRPKEHRALVLANIINEQLFDRGLISYHSDGVKNTHKALRSDYRTNLAPIADIIDSLIPLELDMDLGINNPAKNIVPDHYARTFLSLVAETHVTEGVLFFSEKIWKPIGIGHPFMLVASSGMLAQLRSQGYRTFGQWWNEDYDKETDLDQRIRMILAELKRLSMLSLNELKDIRMQMQSTLKFNQELFNEQWKEMCYPRNDETVFKIVKDIWDSF
jgi:hypothetical protein